MYTIYSVRNYLSIIVLRLPAAIFEAPQILDQRDGLADAASAEFPVKATDLPPKLKGAEIVETLRKLETRWINSGFALSKSDLLC